MAYLLAESSNSAALSKIRAYLNKWRPVRIGLPMVANELEALGMARGQKFDEIVEQVFAIQLTGRGKTAGRAREDSAETFGNQGSAEEERKREEASEERSEGKRRGAADPAAQRRHGTLRRARRPARQQHTATRLAGEAQWESAAAGHRKECGFVKEESAAGSSAL